MHDSLAISWPHHRLNLVRVGIIPRIPNYKIIPPLKWSGTQVSNTGEYGTCVDTNRGKGNNLKLRIQVMPMRLSLA